MRTTEQDADWKSERVRRDLARLQKLLARRRFRAIAMRVFRGVLGSGASFAALIKLKLAGSLVLKGGLALLVGLSLAWPIVFGILLALAFVVLAIVGIMEGETPNCPDTCWEASKRRDRLRELIDERIEWLESRSGGAEN